MKHITDIICYIRALTSSKSEKRMEKRKAFLQQEAERLFNIISRDGVEYITFYGTVVSTKDDLRLVERMVTLREMYVKMNM